MPGFRRRNGRALARAQRVARLWRSCVDEQILQGLNFWVSKRLAYEERIAEIGQRIVESLRDVNGAELRQVGFMELADEHSEGSTRFGVRELALAFTVSE